MPLSPPAGNAWIRAWVLRPIAVLIWIGWAAFIVALVALQPDRPLNWLWLAIAAGVSWQILRGRKRPPESRPEMGTSE